MHGFAKHGNRQCQSRILSGLTFLKKTLNLQPAACQDRTIDDPVLGQYPAAFCFPRAPADLQAPPEWPTLPSDGKEIGIIKISGYRRHRIQDFCLQNGRKGVIL
jgi:hypothetical protein